jgi:hypothetical protein
MLDLINPWLLQPKKRVICLLNCLDLPFTRQIVLRGRNGGLEAGRKLASCIRNSAYIDGNSSFTLVTYVFADKQALVALGNDPATVDAFMVGLNRTPEPTYALDVSQSKKIVTSRIMGA